MIMFDAQYGDTATDAWKKNKFDAWEWQVSNQTVAILQPVQNFTVAMQAKNYPTANHFLASVADQGAIKKTLLFRKGDYQQEKFAPKRKRPDSSDTH